MVDDLESVIEKALGGDGASRAKVREFEPADVVPKLVAQFTSPKTKIRTNAIGMATGIASFVKLVPLEQLLAAISDPDAEVRLAIVIGLKRAFPTEPYFKPQAEQIRPALVPCLKDSDPRVREQAGHAWRALGLP